MNKSQKGRKTGADRTICFCYNVSERVIVAGILESGCRTVMDIRREIFASSGCAGCTEEVRKILRKYVDQETGELLSHESTEPTDIKGENEK